MPSFGPQQFRTNEGNIVTIPELDAGDVMPHFDMAEAVADVVDPSSATAEDVALAVNDLLASLRVAGLLAPEVS